MQNLKNKTNEQAKPNSWIWRTDCLLLEGEGLRGRQDGWRNSRGTHLHYKSNNSLGCNMQPGNYSGSDSSESHSFVSDSLQPHGLYSPRNSPARILEWVAFPFSRGSSQPRDQTHVFRIAGGFFASWATREAQEYWSGWPIPSPPDLPNPGIKLGSPALQVDSLETELSGKPIAQLWAIIVSNITVWNLQVALIIWKKNYVTSYGDRW